MQTIQTKYLPWTDYKPSRVKATAEAGSVTISWDDALNIEENHMLAAEMLRQKLEWDKDCYADMVGGHTKTGMVFVFNTDLYKLSSKKEKAA